MSERFLLLERSIQHDLEAIEDCTPPLVRIISVTMPARKN